MVHACAGLFRPRLGDIGDALYVAGSSLLTLGVSEVDAHGLARWLILAAALSGFGVITATVSFIMTDRAALRARFAAAGYRADVPEAQAIAALVALREDDMPRIRALSRPLGGRSRPAPARPRPLTA